MRIELSSSSNRFNKKSSASTSKEARIIEVIERHRSQWVGQVIEKIGTQWIVQLQDTMARHLNLVRIVDTGTHAIELDDWVAVKIIRHVNNGSRDYCEGIVIEKIGAQDDMDPLTQSVVLRYDLPGAFEDAVNEQVDTIIEQFEDQIQNLEGRQDCRSMLSLTIDPDDAKDYDDAISIEVFSTAQLDDAYCQLAVHIADVAHFLPIDSPIDTQANQRANSTYLPTRVIPMLPAALSNGICSLSEQVDRLTKTCFMRFNQQGECVGYRFANTVICSNKRLTYLQAQQMIDDDNATDEIAQALKAMNALAKKIQAKRINKGMLSLNLPANCLQLNEQCQLEKISLADNAYTHTIIEMFMIEANEAAAHFFYQLDTPIIRRVHQNVDVHDLQYLKRVINDFTTVDYDDNAAMMLQTMLKSCKDQSYEKFIHLQVLRSLTQARYGIEKVGHFALASDHYAHFTSPIRRYSDLNRSSQFSSMVSVSSHCWVNQSSTVAKN